MQRIQLETEIAAPVERCFLLSLNLDLHMESTAGTREVAIAGVTHGVIGPGERVTWRGRHFGLMLTHESVISGYERPSYFQDSMVRGAFRSFVHDHWFEPGRDGQGCVMRDDLCFSAPLGTLGSLVERMVLRRHMRRFLLERNAMIRRVAEAADGSWQRYVGGSAGSLAG